MGPQATLPSEGNYVSHGDAYQSQDAYGSYMVPFNPWYMSQYPIYLSFYNKYGRPNDENSKIWTGDVFIPHPQAYTSRLPSQTNSQLVVSSPHLPGPDNYMSPLGNWQVPLAASASPNPDVAPSTSPE